MTVIGGNQRLWVRYSSTLGAAPFDIGEVALTDTEVERLARAFTQRIVVQGELVRFTRRSEQGGMVLTHFVRLRPATVLGERERDKALAGLEPGPAPVVVAGCERPECRGHLAAAAAEIARLTAALNALHAGAMAAVVAR